jgi:hypothetical protein
MDISDLKKLSSFLPCQDGLAFASTQRILQDAWDVCDRGDWMLWWAAKAGVPREDLVLATCACARLALVDAHGNEAELAIVTAEQWAHGDAGVTLDDVRDAAWDASSAAWEAKDAAVWAAVAWAADTTAAWVDTEAAWADAAVGISRGTTLRQCADICRRFWKDVP